MPASGTGYYARPLQAVGPESGGKPPLALTPWVFPQVELKSQEAQSLQQQRDQYLSHLQQYVVTYQQHVATYQQLASEKEELHKQVLLQTQLMDQLQHEEVQVKMEADMARQELQETQVRDASGGLLSTQGLQHVSLLTLFPGPLGALGSCQPAESRSTGAAEPHGSAWGR